MSQKATRHCNRFGSDGLTKAMLKRLTLTEQHIKEWRWVMSNIEGVADEQVVNFPDYQGRIFRNNKQIKWKYRVHEVIIGNTNYVQLPPEREFALWHIKDIQRQVFQNEYYKTIKRIE